MAFICIANDIFKCIFLNENKYCKVSNIRRTLVGNEIVDHYIFILNLTPGFNGLGKDDCKARQEIFMFGDSVRLILGN